MNISAKILIIGIAFSLSAMFSLAQTSDCLESQSRNFVLLTFQFPDTKIEEIHWVCENITDTVDFENMKYVSDMMSYADSSNVSSQYNHYNNLLRINDSHKEFVEFYSSIWFDSLIIGTDVAVFACPLRGKFRTHKKESHVCVTEFEEVAYNEDIKNTTLWQSIFKTDFYGFDFMKYSFYKNWNGPRCIPYITKAIITNN